MASPKPTKVRARRATKPPPSPPTLIDKAWAAIKRNPVKSVTALLALCAAVPSGVVGLNYLWSEAEPWWIAQRYWVRSELLPLHATQTSQAVAIDRFLLYQLEEAVNKAKLDPAAQTSPIVQDRIKELTAQVQATRTRICKTQPSARGC